MVTPGLDGYRPSWQRPEHDDLADLARAFFTKDVLPHASRLEEQAFGVQGPWVGWGHHHWLCDPVEGGLQIVIKSHILAGRPDFQVPNAVWAAAPPEAELAAMAESLPHLAAMLAEVAHDDPDTTLGWCDDQTEFEFGLDLILDGLDRLRAKS